MVVFPDFQPKRVAEEAVSTYLFREIPFFTSLLLRSSVHFVPYDGTSVRAPSWAEIIAMDYILWYTA
jgi:hypothetical protein